MSGRVILAESAGFCYGVQRAVDLAQKTAEEQGNCWMLGDLIHNSFVVEDLSQRGIRKTADSTLLLYLSRTRSTVLLVDMSPMIPELRTILF